jgi:lauroyl/myristoyl acyltransferase
MTELGRSKVILGQRCKTPSGIVELALRYSYRINFIPANVSISDANFESVALESKVGNVINAMNKCIEQDLLKNPTSWLLWPSLDRRWVNYR